MKDTMTDVTTGATTAAVSPRVRRFPLPLLGGVLLALCALAGLAALLWPQPVPHKTPPQRLSSPGERRLLCLGLVDQALQPLSEQQTDVALRPHAQRTYYQYTVVQPDWQQDSSRFVDDALLQQLQQSVVERTDADSVEFCGGFWMQPQDGDRVAILCFLPVFSEERLEQEYSYLLSDDYQIFSVELDGQIQFIDAWPLSVEKYLSLLQYPGVCHLYMGRPYGGGNTYGRTGYNCWQLLLDDYSPSADGGTFLEDYGSTAVFCPEIDRYCPMGSYEIPFDRFWEILQTVPEWQLSSKIQAWLAESQLPQETVYDCLRRTTESCSMAWGETLYWQLADSLAPNQPHYTLQLTRWEDGNWHFFAFGGTFADCFHYRADDLVVTDVDMADALAHAADSPVRVQPLRADLTETSASLRMLGQAPDGNLRVLYDLASHAPGLLLYDGRQVLQLPGPSGWIPDDDSGAFCSLGERSCFAIGTPCTCYPVLGSDASGPLSSEDLALIAYDAFSGNARAGCLLEQALTPQLLEMLDFDEQGVTLDEQRVTFPTALPVDQCTPILQYSCTAQGITAHLSMLLQDAARSNQWLLEDLLTAKVTTAGGEQKMRVLLSGFCLQQPQLTRLRAPLPPPQPTQPQDWSLQLEAEDCLVPVPAADLSPLAQGERHFYRFTAEDPDWSLDVTDFLDVLPAAEQAVKQAHATADLQFVRGLRYDFDGDGRKEALLQLYGMYTYITENFFYGDGHMVYINADGQAQYLYTASEENICCRLLQYPGFCHIHLTAGNGTAAGGGLSYIYIPRQGRLAEAYCDYYTHFEEGVFIVGTGPQGIGPRYSFYSPELQQYCDTGYQEITPQQAWALLRDSPALTQEDGWLTKWLQERQQPEESAFDCLRRLPCRYRLGGGKYLNICADDDGGDWLYLTLCRQEDGLFTEFSRSLGDYRSFDFAHEDAIQLNNVDIDEAVARATSGPAPYAGSLSQAVAAALQPVYQEGELTLYTPFRRPNEGYLLQSAGSYYWLEADSSIRYKDNVATVQPCAACGGLSTLLLERTERYTSTPEINTQLAILSGRGQGLAGDQLPLQPLAEAVLQQLDIYPQRGGYILTFAGQQRYFRSPAPPLYCHSPSISVQYAVTQQEITLSFTLHLGANELTYDDDERSLVDFATARLTFADGVFTVSDFALQGEER